MKNTAKYIFIMLLLPAVCFGAETAVPADENVPLTLRDCYKLALKESEFIAIDSEQIKIAEAHFLQAFGTLMPQASFSRYDLRQHSPSAPQYDRSFEQKFVFTQELFTGFKEFAQMAASKYEKKQNENEKIRAEQLLFANVSDAFYLVLEEREDIKSLEATESAFADRIKELKTRVDLGKSRNSEVVNTEVQLYSIEEQIELAKSQELVARELLEFLLGRPFKEITETDSDFSLKPEAEYISQAPFRTDVQAADFAWKSDKENIVVARSGFFPAVSLQSDIYGHRASTPTDSKWDALLSINVPIFEGTTTYGQVKEATAKANQSGLLFRRTGREAVQDIHDSYVIAQAAFTRTDILRKALSSAEQNYDLQTQDYKLNVVSNLDVLAAISDLENIRRNFVHTSYEGKRFYWQLQVAAGIIDLGE